MSKKIKFSAVCTLFLIVLLHASFGSASSGGEVGGYNFNDDSLAVLKIYDEPDEDYSFEESSEEPQLYSEETEGDSQDTKISAITVPFKKAAVDTSIKEKLIPCGMTVGVRIDTDGILVLGTGYVNGSDGMAHKPAEDVLIPGDLILSVNGQEVETKEDLRDAIKNAQEEANIRLKREEELLEVSITPVMCIDDNMSKIGVWVRDSTQGIGTVTYINPETNKFGALGHGIMDVDTKMLMRIKAGEVTNTYVHSIKKGKKGAPGELIGDITSGEYFGQVKLNNQYGLYGVVENNAGSFGKEPVPVASKDVIEEGAATILSNIGSDSVKEYEAIIETVNKHSADDSKGMIVRITDEDLLNQTNGIVQGMSGSPILQNGRLVGAVTHVFVQDPAKGYGIFIENMLKQESSF
ncbi:SpoIVB peptidase [Tyzzerella sp. OttesenSCG-928-J15]|nr:SpoIVB peptidase [Tyzzerella sp. OttesenSCG-928-J15]